MQNTTYLLTPLGANCPLELAAIDQPRRHGAICDLFFEEIWSIESPPYDKHGAFVVVVVVVVVVATLFLSASCDKPERRTPPIYCPV